MMTKTLSVSFIFLRVCNFFIRNLQQIELNSMTQLSIYFFREKSSPKIVWVHFHFLFCSEKKNAFCLQIFLCWFYSLFIIAFENPYKIPTKTETKSLLNSKALVGMHLRKISAAIFELQPDFDINNNTHTHSIHWST